MMNMNEMMNTMMEQMMAKMMENMMTTMMSTMMSSMNPQPQVANAEVVKPTVNHRADISEILAEDKKAPKEEYQVEAEFDFWKRTTTKGNVVTWCGWANPATGEEVYPGHQLYYINKFYLGKLGIKKDGFLNDKGNWVNLPGYNMKKVGNKTILANYEVRDTVASKDKDEFIEFMKNADKGQKAMNDSWFE